MRRSKSSTVKSFKNFRELTLDDLKKIKKYYNEYKIKKIIDEKNRQDTILFNNKIKNEIVLFEKQNDEYIKTYCKPIEDYIKFKENSISQYKINSLSSIFLSNVSWNNQLYKNISIVNETIKELELQRLKLLKIKASNPYVKRQNQKEQKVPELVKYKKLFRFNGISYYVYYEEINIDEINKIINTKEFEIENTKSKNHELKAKAASNASETRKVAESAKRKYPLQHQLNFSEYCPYCDIYLKSNKPNLDHIYPVSKGGQSRLENLVWICFDCNAKKSDHLLSQFIKFNNLNKEEIILKLEFLKKETP